MTLTEAKDLTAQDLGYKDWAALIQTKSYDETESDAIHYMEMVAFRFASAKLEEAARLPGIPKNKAIDILKIKLN